MLYLNYIAAKYKFKFKHISDAEYYVNHENNLISCFIIIKVFNNLGHNLKHKVIHAI